MKNCWFVNFFIECWCQFVKDSENSYLFRKCKKICYKNYNIRKETKMKTRFPKFDADQSKQYRKKLALKLKETLDHFDQLDNPILQMESSLEINANVT